MKMKIVKLLTATAMSGLMTIGIASNAMAETGMKHNVADLNKDGMVTTEELLAYVQVNFLKMDKNNDHMLEDKEWDEYWWAQAE